MNFNVNTNAVEISAFMREIGRSQLPFATSLAINNTAKAVQTNQRAHQASTFILRRQFFQQAVKIKPFSTKDSLVAVVRIDPPGGTARSDIVTRHEEDTERRPAQGRTLAVPSEARPSPTALVPKQLLPKRLALKPSTTQGTADVSHGKLRTFSVRGPDGRGAIFQRIGPGKHGTFEGTRKLFQLAAVTMLEPRLDFIENAEESVAETWPDNFAQAWNRALETAR